MNDTEKQISIAATVMALTFVVVFVGVILIGVLGGEIGAMFTKVLLVVTACIFLFGAGFLALKYAFTLLLEEYIASKEPEPSLSDVIRESLAKLQEERDKDDQG